MTLLDKSNTVMTMQGMMSAVTWRTKCNQITKFIVSGYKFLQATFNPRMVSVVYHQIFGSTTKLAFKIISFKNFLPVALKSGLLPRFSLNSFQMFGAKLSSSSQVLLMPNSLQMFGAETLSPVSTTSEMKLLTSLSRTISAKSLPSGSGFKNIPAHYTRFFSIVLHPFRLSLCKGAF